MRSSKPAIAYRCLYSPLHSSVEVVRKCTVECSLARLEVGKCLAVLWGTGEDERGEYGLALALVDHIALLEIGFLLATAL